MRNPGARGPRWMLAVAAILALAVAPPEARATVTVNAPWIRVARGATTAEAYMELRSSDGAAVIAVTSDVVARIAIRSPGKHSGTVRELPLPAGRAVLLAPGGYRFSLIRIARPLELGDYVPLVLTVRNRDGSLRSIPINAEVRRHSAIDDHLHGHAH